MSFLAADSEEEHPLKSTGYSPRPNSLFTGQKKQVSLSDLATIRTIDTTTMEDWKMEADYVDESAIYDDSSSDGEDSTEDSGDSSIDEKSFFRRIDFKASLSTRQSLITLLLEVQNNGDMGISNGASRSTSALPQASAIPLSKAMTGSPNGSEDQHLTMKKTDRPTLLKPISEVCQSVAQPIPVHCDRTHHRAAMSPRTTRLNMLKTELTDSLRHHLLWERRQTLSTANAGLIRRHTSDGIVNLMQYPRRRT